MNHIYSYTDQQYINSPDGRISPMPALSKNPVNPSYNMITNHYQNRPTSPNPYNQYYNQMYQYPQEQHYYNQMYNYQQNQQYNPYYQNSPNTIYSDPNVDIYPQYNSQINHPPAPIQQDTLVTDLQHQNDNINKINELSKLSELYGIDVTSVQGDRLPTRTILLSNIPATTSPKTILNHVKVGIIQQLMIVPTENNNETISAKLTFLVLKHSVEFYCDALSKKLSIDKNKISIEYIDEVDQGHLTTRILKVPQYKPTRNLFIAGFYNLDEDTLHKRLVTDLSSFGPIDTIKIIKEKGIAFIHFLDIEDCIQAFLSVKTYSEFYENKKMGFGRDRCEFVTITEKYNATTNNENNLNVIPDPNKINPSALKNDTEFFTNKDGKVMKKIPISLASYLNARESSPSTATETGDECPYAPPMEDNTKNRNIFIGGLPVNTTLTTICNTVRGGSLEKVKMIKDKNICFVTFLEPQAALDFFTHYQTNDFVLSKKKCTIKWGKHSGPLDPLIKFAVFKGASRNVYVGGVKFNSNNDPFSWVNIKKTFSRFGEVEQINFLHDKGCFFVNFASIQSAVECLDKLRDDPLYKDLQMNYGKDRVGNKPRA